MVQSLKYQKHTHWVHVSMYTPEVFLRVGEFILADKNMSSISLSLQMDHLPLLRTYYYPHKIRLGDPHDGGYVVCTVPGDYDCYICCGVSNESSFDRDFIQMFPGIGKQNSFAFDGTIVDYPYQFTTDITFVKKTLVQ